MVVVLQLLLCSGNRVFFATCHFIRYVCIMDTLSETRVCGLPSTTKYEGGISFGHNTIRWSQIAFGVKIYIRRQGIKHVLYHKRRNRARVEPEAERGNKQGVGLELC